MPIHDQSYRHWEGNLRSHTFRWWTITSEGLRIILRRKLFILIMALAGIQIFIYGGIIYGVNTYGLMFKLNVINPKFFFDFIMRQTFFISLVCIFAGSGLIANDLKNNALQLYLSKPLTRIDYLIGKVMIILILLAFITLVPGILLFIENAILSQDLTFLQEEYWIIGAIIVFSLILIIPTGLLILTLSSITKNNRYTAISFIAILMGTPIFSGLITAILKFRWGILISYWSNLEILGRKLFRLQGSPSYWYWSTIIVIGIIGLCIWIIQRKVKGVEIIK